MFPIKEKYSWPNSDGLFGAVRKYDIHTGIDLYCANRTRIYAVENGIVISIENFTGPKAHSPWWNNTQAVLIKGRSGVLLYGEINCLVSLDDAIVEGQLLGIVKTILKKNKNKPMSMLHFELYNKNTKQSVMWQLNQQKPVNLINPKQLLKNNE